MASALSFAAACQSSTEADSAPRLTFTKLALDLQHTCGLTPQGDVYCWGEGGMLGNGSETQATRPTRVAGDRKYIYISAGSRRTCALSTDSLTYCWGHGRDGVTSILVPTLTESMKFRSISVGGYSDSMCGLTAARVAYCWGLNEYGQVGSGTRDPAAVPTRVAGDFIAIDVTIHSGAHACLLATDGVAWCWGYNGQGELGIADTAYTCSPVLSCAFPAPMQVKGGSMFSSIAAGGSATCALTTARRAYCWGGTFGGGAGADTCIPIIPCDPAPTPVPGNRDLESINLGSQIACAIAVDHHAYCWGTNSEGQLGIGTRTDAQTPTQVAGAVLFRSVFPGIRHTCAIAENGEAYCWGNNVASGLGIGTSGGIFTTPQRVASP